jgi:tRNA uridine 5-carboxymethylaminomethyl modification enzyme
LPEVNKVVAEQAEIHAKYEGYIAKQKLAVERALKLENKKIPENFDYKNLKELSGEAMEKLMKVKPDSVGQAARISGVSPADVGVLLIALEVKRRREEEKHE